MINEFILGQKYFNCGSTGPMPKSSISNMYENMKIDCLGPTGKIATEKLIEVYHGVKNEMAEFLHTSSTNLGYIQSTNVGIGTILGALEWSNKDEIIMGKNEYIDAVLPFLSLREKFGVKIKTVEDDDLVLGINKLMNENVKLIFFSHVECSTGNVNELNQVIPQIKKNQNVKIMVDGAQSVGQIKIENIELSDFYVFPFHKWMLGPIGTGMIYINSKSIEGLKPLTLNKIGSEINPDGSITFDKRARIIENSSFSYIQYSGILSNIQVFKTIGNKNIYDKMKNLSDYFVKKLNNLKISGVEKITNKNGMSFIYFDKTVSADDINSFLDEDDYICRTFESNQLRVCFHYYNSYEEIDNLIDKLSTITFKESIYA